MGFMKNSVAVAVAAGFGAMYSTSAFAGSCAYTLENAFIGPLQVCAQDVDENTCTTLGMTDNNSNAVYSAGSCNLQGAIGICADQQLPGPGPLDETIADLYYFDGEPGGLEIGCMFAGGDWSYGPFDTSTVEAGLVALVDASSSSVPDFATLADPGNSNLVNVVSGASGATVRTIDFFLGAWELKSIASFSDGDSDGLPHDPAIVGVAKNAENGRIQVKVRDAVSGSRIGNNITFFSSQWLPLAIAVLEDADGNGVANDPAAAVLAQRTGSGKFTLEVRRLNDGTKIARYNFFNQNWTPKGVVAYSPAGGTPSAAVLATDNNNNQSRVQVRRLSDGNKQLLFAFGANVETTGLALVNDADGDGTSDDPAFVVLGKRSNGSGNFVRVTRASDGQKIADRFVINDGFDATDLAVLPDVNNTGYEDVAALAIPTGGGDLLLKIRDLETGSNIGTVRLVESP